MDGIVEIPSTGSVLQFEETLNNRQKSHEKEPTECSPHCCYNREYRKVEDAKKIEQANALQEISSQIVEAIQVIHTPLMPSAMITIQLYNVGALDGTKISISLVGNELSIEFLTKSEQANDFLARNTNGLIKELETKLPEYKLTIRSSRDFQGQNGSEDNSRSKNPYWIEEADPLNN